MQLQSNPSVQSFLTHYGEPLAVYQGEGSLKLRNGQEFKCNFEAGQMRCGNVVLLCDFLPPFPFLLEFPALSFEGSTPQGYRIVTKDGITETNYLPELPRRDQGGVFSAFKLAEMTVLMTATSHQSRTTRFGVTNCLFAGTDKDDSGNLYLPLVLKDISHEMAVSVMPVKGYTTIAKRIQTLKSAEVTCEIVCGITKDVSQEAIAEVVEGLCFLLSVSRGTKIQWVYCDHYSQSGERLKRTHSSRITKSYSPWSVIDPRGSARNETKSFVEQCYSVYMSRRDSYKLHKGTIDAYLDAKAEQDYLEMRAVKLAVALERLKAVYSKTMSLKKESFKVMIDSLVQTISLNATSQEITLFVACRNSLIHEGEFYCVAATEAQRIKCPPLPSMQEEYCFIVNFLDRIFLKLLRYSGPYIDWRMPPESDRRGYV